MTRENLEKFLSKAVTMTAIASDVLNTLGDDIDMDYDDIRRSHIDCIYRIGAQFIGRAAILWSEWQSNSRFYAAYDFNLKVRDYTVKDVQGNWINPLKDIVLQAAIFEFISTNMFPWDTTPPYPDSEIVIPDWVFEEFALPVENRTFNVVKNGNSGNEGMLFNNLYDYSNSFDPVTGFYPIFSKSANLDTTAQNKYIEPGGYVPDISKIETQMWFFYRAVMYMTIGYEAIHFGQMEIMAEMDTNHISLWSLLARIRRVAAQGLTDSSGSWKQISLYNPNTGAWDITTGIRGARRGWVLCDAHTIGMKNPEGILVFDFHSFPLSLHIAEKFPNVTLERRTYNSDFGIIGRSMGGKTFFGWQCESLPYLIEVDNYGISDWRYTSERDQWFPWGYDQITWWGHALTKQERDTYIAYFHHRLRFLDRNGFFQPPLVRGMVLPYNKLNYPKTYFGHSAFGQNFGHGNQEEALSTFLTHKYKHWYLDFPFNVYYPTPSRNFVANSSGQIFYVSNDNRLCVLGALNGSWYIQPLDWSFPANVAESIALDNTIGIFYKGTDSYLHRSYWDSIWYHQAQIGLFPQSGGGGTTPIPILGKIVADSHSRCFYISAIYPILCMTYLNSGGTFSTAAITPSLPSLGNNNYQLLGYEESQQFLLLLNPQNNLILYKHDSILPVSNWTVMQISFLANATREVVVSPQGDIYYIGADGHLYECVFTAGFWQTKQIAPTNAGNLLGYLSFHSVSNCVIYKGMDNRLWQAYNNETGWHRDALDWYAPANVADNVVIDNEGTIFYRGTDNRIHTFVWQAEYGKWKYEAVLAWRSEGNPNWQSDNVGGHLTVNRITNEVFYIDTHQQLCRIIRSDGFDFLNS